jgi:hypothetical protein
MSHTDRLIGALLVAVAMISTSMSTGCALVNVIASLSEGRAKFVPDILVTGGGNGGGALDGLAATAMRFFNGGNGKHPDAIAVTQASPAAEPAMQSAGEPSPPRKAK